MQQVRRAQEPTPTQAPAPASELTGADRAALTGLVPETIERDRFPPSPRIRELKAILAKLDPPRPIEAPYPLAKA